jgi:hypothetical protein
LENVVLPVHLDRLGSGFFSQCRRLQNVSLPFNLTEIGDYAFSMSGLRHLTLPDSIVNVTRGALNGSAIESISIGNELRTFSIDVFSNCSSLREVHLRGEIVTSVVCESIKSFDKLIISVDENCRNKTTCGREPVRPTPTPQPTTPRPPSPEATPTPTLSRTPNPSKHLSVEVIFGVTVGSVVLLALVIVVIVLIRRRKGQKDVGVDTTVLTSLVTAQFTD